MSLNYTKPRNLSIPNCLNGHSEGPPNNFTIRKPDWIENSLNHREIEENRPPEEFAAMKNAAVEATRPKPSPDRPSKRDTLQSINHTTRLDTNLPGCGPFGLLFGGFDTGMEARFILVTNWNVDLYGVPELCEEAGGRKAGHSAVRPGFVSRDGLFVRHKLT
jgi:hypothetical protein